MEKRAKAVTEAGRKRRFLIEISRLETELSDRKQKADAISNREKNMFFAGAQMTLRRRDFNSFLAVSLSSLLFNKPSAAAPPAKKILAIGDVHRKVYQHDA